MVQRRSCKEGKPVSAKTGGTRRKAWEGEETRLTEAVHQHTLREHMGAFMIRLIDFSTQVPLNGVGDNNQHRLTIASESNTQSHRAAPSWSRAVQDKQCDGPLPWTTAQQGRGVIVKGGRRERMGRAGGGGHGGNEGKWQAQVPRQRGSTPPTLGLDPHQRSQSRSSESMD